MTNYINKRGPILYAIWIFCAFAMCYNEKCSILAIKNYFWASPMAIYY